MSVAAVAARWINHLQLVEVEFGLGATVLYLIPLAILVAPPFAAAGATLAFIEEARGDKQKADQQKAGEPLAKSTGNVAANT